MTPDTNDALKRKALEIHRRLLDEYGEPQWRPGRDPVASLVQTIISQNTNDINRDVAYERLRERFPTWEHQRAAHPGSVAGHHPRTRGVDAGLSLRPAPRPGQSLADPSERRGT